MALLNARSAFCARIWGAITALHMRSFAFSGYALDNPNMQNLAALNPEAICAWISIEAPEPDMCDALTSPYPLPASRDFPTGLER